VLRGDSSQADADTAAPHQEEYRMTMLAALVDGVIGVDPHRDTLTAAAVTNLGGVLAQTTTTADAIGYVQLLGFAQTHLPDPGRCWAVEGAGSFGAGLASFLTGRGERVVEVGGPSGRTRTGAKSDPLDAVRAAREALGQDHRHMAMPRRRGEREALRALLTTRRSATLARVAAIGQLKALIVGAPEELRAELRGRPPRARSAPAPACATGRSGR
jgi:transposase